MLEAVLVAVVVGLLVVGAAVLLVRRSASRLSPSAGGVAPPAAVRTGGGEAGAAEGEREQALSDLASRLRKVLLRIADQIHHADTSAGESSEALGVARMQIERLELDAELKDAQRLLLSEIDRVLTSNGVLRRELESAHTTLEEQRGEIDTLRAAARVDSLTGLANRGHLTEHLGGCLARFERHGEPFSLLMVDADKFKTINDTRGHPAGDRILRGLAKKMQVTLRANDFLARYGGEEFAVILEKSDRPQAERVAEKLRAAVEAAAFRLDGERVPVTISIGVAQVRDGDGTESILARADQALYQAKRDGRNRVRAVEA